MARRAAQLEPLEIGIASVGLSLRGEESHLMTVGSLRNVGMERWSVEVRLRRSVSARALLVFVKDVAGRGPRQMGKREASVTKMEVGVGVMRVGRRAAEIAWSVVRPLGHANERRSLRWIR